MSRVRDIVDDRKLFWVEENDTVAAAARRMAELQVGGNCGGFSASAT
ncbi:MAG: hypothetical protein LAQ30_27775 [Acidobacteriia bacterium]|nr:hypothetical protein [Terriglobia bacterium]